MLASHPHHIGAPLPSVEQECECQPRARSDRVTLLELGNLGIAPAMETLRLYADRAHVPGRIVSSKANLDRVPHHGPQYLPELVCGLGFVCFCRNQANDVLTSD